MKKLRPYISIGTNENNRVFIVVEDYELFDFVDDYLTEECDLCYEYRTSQERTNGEIVTMFFPDSIKMMELEEAILLLPEEKIMDIYLLNNKQSSLK